MDFKWWLNDQEAEALLQAGQIFASGFMKDKGLSVVQRHANGILAELSYRPLPDYSGEYFYPAVPVPWPAEAVWHNYVAIDLTLNTAMAQTLLEAASDDLQRSAFSKLVDLCESYPRGGGYTHSIVNFGRVLAEGLSGYEQRIRILLEKELDTDKRDLLSSLLKTIAAIDLHRQRIVDYLSGLHFEDTAKETNRTAILSAYQSGLPMRRANGFHEAMIATAFIYHVDGYDDLGRFDQFMHPYYQADIASGKLSRETAVDMVRQLWKVVDQANGWNVALGGSNEAREQAANELTLVCLEAGRGCRRPNLALRLRKDTPEEIWDSALDCIRSGTGIPALYCEENYLAAIDAAQLNLPESDKMNFAFGGCTELMVHGCSNVGSLDGDISIIGILQSFLVEQLPACPDFETLKCRFREKLVQEIYRLTSSISANQEIRARYHPQLIRSLLVDDCIDRRKNYYNGGARYNWSVVNVVGLSNAIDSLVAVKKALYDLRNVTADEMVEALLGDFADSESLRSSLSSQPKYGNDDQEVNDLANELSGFIFREFKRYAPWRGGKFICGTLMFTTYAWYGEPVGATPDGRRAGLPVADSAGPVQGRDRNGPTAMLSAAASLSQKDAPGTLVVNIRLSADMLDKPENREQTKSLIRSYFDLGGMQLQVNVVDQKILEHALKFPEQHQDLVIRMGGYSEYWGNLTPELRVSVLERTEHS